MILLACPIHECKEYALKRWADKVRLLTYPNLEVFTVDNSPSAELAQRWENQFPIVHLTDTENEPHAMLRITKSMEVIRQHFLAGDYHYWFNLECDVIPPNDVIERMLALGRGADWIAHEYPPRGDPKGGQQGIGLSLLSRRLMENFNFLNAGDNSPDGWLWSQVKWQKKYQVVELWGYFPVEHLSE